MHPIHEAFATTLSHQWQTQVVGAGRLKAGGGSIKFSTGGATSNTYTNSQIDDYQGLPRSRFAWRPPLRLTVRARFSHASDQLRGTAGFGFWNDPLFMTERRLPALPRALWFLFAAPPSDMKLDMNAAGNGWKAASIDAQRSAAIRWAPLAPLLVPLMNLGPVYRALWPHIQGALGVSEVIVPVDMTRWHTYVLQWGTKHSQFSVIEKDSASSQPLLTAPSPRGPLGFVMWQDNQYLVLAPWGRVRWGLSEVPGRQWMEVDLLEIIPLAQDKAAVSLPPAQTAGARPSR